MAIHEQSFLNGLRFLLMLAAMLHMFTQDGSTRVVQDAQDRPETTYCKFPQTQKLEEAGSCSSTQNLFFLLGNDCSYQKEPKEFELPLALRRVAVEEKEGEEEDWDSFKAHVQKEEISYVGDVTTEDADERDEKGADKDGDGVSSRLVDSFVICLLVFSAGVSLAELYRERLRKRNAKQQVDGEGPAPGEGKNALAPRSCRMSLADLAVNRHIRRKETHHHQVVRQASTSAVVRPGFKPPPMIRRSSFPARFPEGHCRQAPQRQQSHPGVPPSRRMSVDLVDDDSSPDRRRVRIIRRH